MTVAALPTVRVKPPSLATVERRLLRWYGLATEEQRAEGLAWYDTARNRVATLAVRYSTPPKVVAAIIAVLSPRTSWGRNLRAAEDMLDLGYCRDGGVLGTSVDKARLILDAQTPDAGLGGRKVTAFYRNLTGDTDAVTVDSWIVRAAGWHTDQPTKRAYALISEAAIRAARKVGCTPMAFQACVWVVIRDDKGKPQHRNVE